MCSYPQVLFDIGNMQKQSKDALCAIVSPPVLEHPFQVNEVARGSKRMAHDIPDFVQDLTRKFIVVGFCMSTLCERLKLLPCFLFYCLAHDFDMLVYFESSPACNASYAEVLCNPSNMQNTYKLNLELAPLTNIDIHIWEQPNWDGWAIRAKQTNCAGSFLADDLMQCDDFNIQSLHYILSNLNEHANERMNEWWAAVGCTYSENILTGYFAIRDNFQTVAQQWMLQEIDAKTSGYDRTICLIVDPPLNAGAQRDLIEQSTGDQRAVHEWDIWVEGAALVKQRALQQYGEYRYLLVVICQHPDIYDRLFRRFGNTIHYGPVHDAGFHDRAGFKKVGPLVSDTAYNMAAALTCQEVAGWEGSPMFEYVLKLGAYDPTDVFSIPPSGELTFAPSLGSHHVPAPPSMSFLHLRTEGNWNPASPTYQQLFARNSQHICASQAAYVGIPKASIPIIREINTESLMYLFHELVKQVSHSNNDLDVSMTKMGQCISGDSTKYAEFQKNRQAYNKIPSIDTVGNPKWLRAVFEGPYKHYRKTVLNLPPYHHYGGGLYKMLTNPAPQTETDKRRKLAVAKAKP